MLSLLMLKPKSSQKIPELSVLDAAYLLTKTFRDNGTALFADYRYTPKPLGNYFKVDGSTKGIPCDITIAKVLNTMQITFTIHSLIDVKYTITLIKRDRKNEICESILMEKLNKISGHLNEYGVDYKQGDVTGFNF